MVTYLYKNLTRPLFSFFYVQKIKAFKLGYTFLKRFPMTRVQIIFYLLCILVPLLFVLTVMGYSFLDLLNYFNHNTPESLINE